MKKKMAKTKVEKKPWPTCMKCKKPSVYMRRVPVKNGDPVEEHYCADHWGDRAPRFEDTPPKKTTGKKKPLKKRTAA